MAYCIGLDCGTTSVGWAVLELDSNEEPCRIINLGSRIFTAAENPKTGASLALPRREKRSMRRRLRRHRHRNERIRNLIVDKGILSQAELNSLFDGNLSDIYELRTQALDRKLNQAELARVMINLAQRRGFKSNRKNPAGDDEAGKLLSAVSINAVLMESKAYRTVGEMFFKDEKFSQTKRNKGENYSNTVSRDMVESEIRQIFAAQRNLGNAYTTEAIEEAYVEIVLSQRSFEEGPGGDSKYGGNQIEKMMGSCTLIPEEKRAVKASYSFQLFNLWQKINNIRITGKGEIRPLTDAERKMIFDLAHDKAAIKFADLRKKLNLSDEERFNMLNYSAGVEKAEKTNFNYLKEYHEIRKALDKGVYKGRIKTLSVETLNQIGYIFTVYKNDEKITEALSQLELDAVDVKALMTLGNFSKVGHISVKACDALIPYLENGMKYNEACDAAGFNFRSHDGEKSMYLPGYAPELADLTNPVVKRAVSQTIKVINAIVREQGESPVFINIELAREMSKNFIERNQIKKKNDENQAANERIMEELRNNFGLISPTGQDLIKYKLWCEQDGVCAYSQKQIKLEKLFTVGYAEVDHIFPYSISFNDSFNNKVLVLAEENRQKGNRLPLQYLEGDRREKYLVWVNANVKNYRKKQIMLKETVTQADRDAMKERSLQDTQYLSRFLYNYISDNMEFAPSVTGKKKRVTSVNGAVTAYIRKRWGIRKIREDGDLHHAADAVVIACVTNGMIKRISDYTKYNEVRYSHIIAEDPTLVLDSYTGEVTDRFPYPWPTFRKELEMRLSNNPQSILKDLTLPNYTAEQSQAVKPCFVSRMPTRKTKGAAHKETVRSAKCADEGLVITKTPLTSLKLKNGEIEGYYNPGSDRLLYEALKARLAQFGGDGKLAFEQPFYKPRSNGEKGPLVKTVKICEKSSLNVNVYGGKGVAVNDSMVRIDVYHVENEGYYFVPIYVADTIKAELPNKAVTRDKPYDEWKEMSEDSFIFSLYPNDLIKIESKNDTEMTINHNDSSLPKKHVMRDELVYYQTASISTASITVITHDNTYSKSSLGVKTLTSFEKYETDALGNCRKVGKETRQKFKA